jgi:hypothetical protein
MYGVDIFLCSGLVLAGVGFNIGLMVVLDWRAAFKARFRSDGHKPLHQVLVGKGM